MKVKKGETLSSSDLDPQYCIAEPYVTRGMTTLCAMELNSRG